MGDPCETVRYGAEAHLCGPCAEGFHGDCLGYPQAALGSCLCSCPDASYGRSRQLIRLPDVPLRPLPWRRRLLRKIEDVRRWGRMKRIIWADRGVGASTRKGEDALPLSEVAGQGSSSTPDAEREVVTRFAAPTPPLTDRELPAQPNGHPGSDAR